MADYSRMKNVELEALLKERSLPHTGKKAELVARLVEDDNQRSSSKLAKASPAVAAKGEDDITWDDEEESSASVSRAKNALDTSTEALAIQPSAATKISAKNSTPKITTAPPPEATTSTETNSRPGTEPTPTTKDFTSGLPITDVDAELEKRKKRAAKFGLPMPDSTSSDGKVSNSDAVKALERAKRFGTDSTTNVISRLDGALPERPQRKTKKRGSDAMLDGGQDRATDDSGLKKARGGRGRTSATVDASEDKKVVSGVASWMSDADRAKAEARKNKWAAPVIS